MNPELSVYLDLMRLLAAGMVLASHLNAHAVTGGQLWRIDGYSTEGVIFFFVLSGFVISYVASRREHSPRDYFVARTARIYSVAVLAVPVTLAADAIGKHMMPSLYYGHEYFNPDTGLIDILASLSFTNELWYNGIIVGTDQPFWSLGFEVWYYAIFGVLFFLRYRTGLACAALLLVVIGPKIALYFPVWLIGWASFFFIEHARKNDRSPVPPIVGAALFVLAPAVYLIIHAHPPLQVPIFGTSFTVNLRTVLSWAYYVVVAVLFAAHLIGFVAISSVFTRPFALCGAVVRWAAGASFTLYLVHQPIMLCLAAVAPWPQESILRLLFVGFGTVIVVLVVAELGERRKRSWQRAIAAVTGFVVGRSSRTSVEGVRRLPR